MTKSAGKIQEFLRNMERDDTKKRTINIEYKEQAFKMENEKLQVHRDYGTTINCRKKHLR